MSNATRVTNEGQVTIPKQLRNTYDLNPGDAVVWIDTDEGIIVTKRTQTGGRGMLVPDETPEEKREEIAEALVQRLYDRRDRDHADF